MDNHDPIEGFRVPGPAFYLGWRGAYLQGYLGPDPYGLPYVVNSVFLSTANANATTGAGEGESFGGCGPRTRFHDPGAHSYEREAENRGSRARNRTSGSTAPGDRAAETMYQDANPAIVDTKPPALETITADPQVITISNRRLVPVTIRVHATDDVDWTPWCRVESVKSNQPSRTAAGEDFAIVEALKVYLRAERAIAGGHREYTINVRCQDRSGKTSTLRQVKVPVAPRTRRG